MGGLFLQSWTIRRGVMEGMGTATFVDGHVFEFATGICAKCGMREDQYEREGEPQCTGKKPADGALGAVQPRTEE
jgi:hypothetical protein